MKYKAKGIESLIYKILKTVQIVRYKSFVTETESRAFVAMIVITF